LTVHPTDVRIPEAELERLHLEHLTSAVDMSISLPKEIAELSPGAISGYTEWVATWCGMRVTIGWDWAIVGERPILIHANEIRTNVQLISKSGVARSRASTRMRLAKWLETLPWREGPIHELIQWNARRPS
jgi:hypothetical protein